MKRFAIFQELNEEQIELLRPLFEDFSCQPGTVIFRQGEQAEYLYLVTRGKVDMSFKPYDGMPMTISHVGSGGLFGWSAVVGRDKYTSTAVAIAEVEAFRVHGSQLRKLCREKPDVGRDILEHLADGVSARWQDAHRQVKSILSQGLRENFNSI